MSHGHNDNVGRGSDDDDDEPPHSGQQTDALSAGSFVSANWKPPVFEGQRPNQVLGYYVRLVKFYQKYNPEKLSRVEEFLNAYRGEEEDLFRILAQKYGPEPDRGEAGESESEELNEERVTTSSRSFYPRRSMSPQNTPQFVMPHAGHTKDPTPYWPTTTLISETDLCSLLAQNGRSKNPQILRCYLGVLEKHPEEASNGMIYVYNGKTPQVAEGAILVAGHEWDIATADSKHLVYKHQAYLRTTMYCTEQCRDGKAAAPHERWRLTVLKKLDQHSPIGDSPQPERLPNDSPTLAPVQNDPRDEEAHLDSSAPSTNERHSTDRLFRFVWHPVSYAPKATSTQGAPDSVSAGRSPEPKKKLLSFLGWNDNNKSNPEKEKEKADASGSFSVSNTTGKELGSPFLTVVSRGTGNISPAEASNLSAGGNGDDSSSSVSALSSHRLRSMQPLQPQYVDPVEVFMQQFNQLEQRLMSRMDSLEARITALEKRESQKK